MSPTNHSEQSIERRALLKAAGVGLGASALSGLAAAAQAQTGGTVGATTGAKDAIIARDYWAKKGDVMLAMYRKRLGEPAVGETPRPVLFMVHGSSNSALSSYDLQAPGKGEYSMMDYFARLGFDVWTMDHEGYGKSTRTSGNSDIKSGVEDLKAA